MTNEQRNQVTALARTTRDDPAATEFARWCASEIIETLAAAGEPAA
jgi:hypothetical protein